MVSPMRLRIIAPLTIALAVLAGCSHSISSGSPSTSASGGTAATPTFGQFTDVPIPDGARMDADRSLLVGPADSWVGRLVFSVRWSNAPELFDFFKAKMPSYQWQEISSVRADISVMTWQRGDRIATIQIEETTFGAGVTLTMGPVAGASAVQPSAAQPPQPNANLAPGQTTVIQSPNAGATGAEPAAPTVTQQPLQQ